MKKVLLIFLSAIFPLVAKGNFFLGGETAFTYQEQYYDFLKEESTDWDFFKESHKDTQSFAVNFNLGYEFFFLKFLGLRPMVSLGYGTRISSKDNFYDRYSKNSFSLKEYYSLHTQAWLDLLLSFPTQTESLEVGFFFGGGYGLEYANFDFKERDSNTHLITKTFTQKNSLQEFRARLGITFKINNQHRLDFFVAAPFYSFVDISDSRYGKKHFEQKHELIPNSASIVYYFLF